MSLNDEELRDLLEDMTHVDLEIYVAALIRAVEAHIRGAGNVHETTDPDDPCSLCRLWDALDPFKSKVD